MLKATMDEGGEFVPPPLGLSCFSVFPSRYRLGSVIPPAEGGLDASLGCGDMPYTSHCFSASRIMSPALRAFLFLFSAPTAGAVG